MRNSTNSPPKDSIIIQEIVASCILGVFPHERDTPRKVLINLELHLDLRKSAITDDLSDTIDYDGLIKKLKSKIELTEFKLIEKLAEYVAEQCLKENTIEHVTVEIHKPNCTENNERISVKIHRRN